MYDLAVITAARKTNDSCRASKECIITSAADIIAWMDAGASLPHNDTTGQDLLSGINLDAKHLGLGVTAILGGAYAFLVCHIYLVSLFRQ